MRELDSSELEQVNGGITVAALNPAWGSQLVSQPQPPLDAGMAADIAAAVSKLNFSEPYLHRSAMGS